jgi:hypothetical protein
MFVQTPLQTAQPEGHSQVPLLHTLPPEQAIGAPRHAPLLVQTSPVVHALLSSQTMPEGSREQAWVSVVEEVTAQFPAEQA